MLILIAIKILFDFGFIFKYKCEYAVIEWMNSLENAY